MLIQRGDFLGSGDALLFTDRSALRFLIENRALAAGHVSLLRQLGQPGAVLREVDRLYRGFRLAGIPATHGGLNARLLLAYYSLRAGDRVTIGDLVVEVRRVTG